MDERLERGLAAPHSRTSTIPLSANDHSSAALFNTPAKQIFQSNSQSHEKNWFTVGLQICLPADARCPDKQVATLQVLDQDSAQSPLRAERGPM